MKAKFEHAKRLRRLNRFFSEEMTADQLVDQFIYLTNKARRKVTTEANIRKYHREGRFAQVLKRLDPTAFYQEEQHIY